jgi:hypothetical protein
VVVIGYFGLRFNAVGFDGVIVGVKVGFEEEDGGEAAGGVDDVN